jgi:hypothetical protein
MIEKTVLFQRDGGALASDGFIQRQRGCRARSANRSYGRLRRKGPKMLVDPHESGEDDLDVMNYDADLQA